MTDPKIYGKKKNEIEQIEKILSEKLNRNDHSDVLKYENKLYYLLNEIIQMNEGVITKLTAAIENLQLQNTSIKNDENLNKKEKEQQINKNKKKISIRFDLKTKLDIENEKYKAKFQKLEEKLEIEKKKSNALKEAAENLKKAAAEKARKDQEAAEKDQEAAENLKKAAAEKARKENYVNLKPIKIGAKTHNCRCKMKIQ